MRMTLHSAAPILIILATTLPAQSATKRAMTYGDFAAVKAVSDPQISPDGQSVLFTVRRIDIDANRRITRSWLAPVAGGESRPFPDAQTSVSEARWSPDGSRIAFIIGGQLAVSAADGGKRTSLTRLTGGATGPVWSPRGDRILFTSGVYPDCDSEACNAQRDSAHQASKVKAHVADQLMYRHWNAWDEGTRSHLFVVALDGSAPRDLTPGARFDTPPGPFGGSEGYAFSPDGGEIAYTAKDQGRADAWTTDANIYLVPATGGTPVVITQGNPGADQNPVYSPDGRYIAYASQRRGGFESDRWRLMLYDRAARQSRELLPAWDRNADSYSWSPDSRAISIATTDAGRDKLYRVALDGRGAPGKADLVIGEHNSVAFSWSRDGRTIAFSRDAADHPAEVWVATLGTGAATTRALTHLNDSLVAQLAVQPAQDFWFASPGADSIQGFVVKPPHWDAGKKYPVVLLIHGGPQGAFLDQWHSRWNYQMFTAPGIGVVIINPRGSFGYGQKFVDEISKDWGGKVYVDLMRGVDAALARNSWMDSTRMGAAGGSYGGYMVNWIAGHTNRFKALVSHAGPFNLENMYGATEELWFPEWEYGGPTWDTAAMREQYRIYSPHLYARNFRTPTLVTAGELDYRVPYTEDLSFFTALQRQDVPSRLVVFPDEGHWILKPQNQRLWWSEVQGWFRKYLTPSDTRASR
ncbi:MAG: prolyl oligopeptidase family serine peptidase [Gemmatimonadaceae bacterium]